MNNPYVHASGPAPATPEAQKRADYELAIGQNADYYLPKFEEFDKGGSKLGWHWPAFFVTTPWFLYRKMWGWGMGNLAYFWGILTFIAPIAVGIAAGAADKGSEVSAMVTVGVVIGVLLLIPSFLLPMFANALYWGHLNKMMDKIPSSIAQQPDKRATRIERNGGTGMGAMIGVVIGGFFIFIFIVGILAAISIPAYQDYTIRAQVTEGLTLSAGAKAAVAEYHARNKDWPLDADAAGLQAINGKYVDSVTVANGSVVITFGGLANEKLAGQRLILAPGLTQQDDIVWTCGERGVPPEAVTMGPGPQGSDVPQRYLPRHCRAE